MGIGRFENIILRFTTAIASHDAFEVSPPSDSPESQSIASDSVLATRRVTASGLGNWATLPSRRWCPIMSVGRFCGCVRHGLFTDKEVQLHCSIVDGHWSANKLSIALSSVVGALDLKVALELDQDKFVVRNGGKSKWQL
jgi:hypothetical protein